MNESQNKNKGKSGKYSRKNNSHNRNRNCNTSNNRKNGNSLTEKVERDMLDERKAPNAFSWYNKNPQLIKDNASINTTNRTGYKYPLTSDGTTNYTNNVLVPGIMSIMTQLDLPAYGFSESTADPTDPVNTAAQNQYSFYRHANSGSVNYDAPDLMLANCAAAEAFAALAWGQRAYGTLNLYNQRNRYTPQALVRAQGFNYDACVDDMAKFRGYINKIAAKLSVVWLPKTYDFVSRWVWLFSNVYTDSTSAKSQMYLFVPTGFHYFSPKTSEQGSQLLFSPINYNSTGLTPKQWFDYMNDLIANLITDEDLGIMFGDMLKAYGAGNIFAPAMIPETYGVVPVHNQEVLLQIMNATTSSVHGQTYQQTGNGVIYAANGNQVIVNATPFTGGALLNFWDEAPTPEIVVEATRLTTTNIITPGETIEAATVRCISCTEHVTNFRIWYYQNDISDLRYINYGTMQNRNAASTVAIEALLSAFDWHPQMWIFEQGPSTPEKPVNSTIDFVVFDVDNYAGISVSTLENIHDVCAWSLFNVPIQV